ncbi:hypothetical protein DRO58_01795 [Candidatus Bathyarchaeota archaeon]|nr:MAG: hypothetical protein DRO58_01795 [Candidatus Bathyarchaeota archaeon]
MAGSRNAGLAAIMLIIAAVFAVAFPAPAEAQTPQEETVDGTSFLTVTGDVFATEVTVTGYNARTNTLHLTLVFYNGTDVASIPYNVTVYNLSGAKIGSNESSVTTSAGVSYYTVENFNVEITGAEALPAGYRVVVTVDTS